MRGRCASPTTRFKFICTIVSTWLSPPSSPREGYTYPRPDLSYFRSLTQPSTSHFSLAFIRFYQSFAHGQRNTLPCIVWHIPKWQQPPPISTTTERSVTFHLGRGPLFRAARLPPTMLSSRRSRCLQRTTRAFIVMCIALYMHVGCNGAQVGDLQRQSRTVWKGPQSRRHAQESKLLKKLEPHLESAMRNGAGRCKCRTSSSTRSIESRYRSAFIVVRAKVLRWTESKQFTRNGAIPQFLVRNYILKATGLYKGSRPSSGTIFQAQGFTHGDSCGLKLEVGRQYLFNMDNPKQRSHSNIWRKGIFVINRCQNHYGWRSLSKEQLRFFLLRSK